MPKRKAPFPLGKGDKRQSLKGPRQRTREKLCLQTKKDHVQKAWEVEGFGQGLGEESAQYGE